MTDNQFTDNTGREWAINFTMGNMGAIKSKLDLDIATPDGIENYCTLASTDRNKFVDVLWQVVEADATSKGVSEADFHNGLDGKALHDAEQAMNEAFITWQYPKARDAVRKAIEAHAEALAATSVAIVKYLSCPDFEAKMAQHIEDTIAKPFRERTAAIVS